ncbi:hypothetical protein Dimus_007151 [Dionaea muscipula]
MWIKIEQQIMKILKQNYREGEKSWKKKKKKQISFIPKDVPKGHMVVYVGRHLKRYVINIAVLKHPLFVALLDQARDDDYYFTASSKLCVSCDESTFIDIIRSCATIPEEDVQRSLR